MVAPCISQMFYSPQHPCVPAGNAANPGVSPCQDGSHTCQAPARCQPGVGTEYTCECAAGYRPDGHGCRGQRGWGELQDLCPIGHQNGHRYLGLHSTHRASPSTGMSWGKLRQGAGAPWGSAPGADNKEEGKKEKGKKSKINEKIIPAFHKSSQLCC